MGGLVEIALKYEGFPARRYRHPDIGNTPAGFDCSGYVQWIILESGMVIPHIPNTIKTIRHTEEFFDFLGFLIHEPARQPGDLVFFSRNGLWPSHVGMYIGAGNMVHSPGTDGRKVGVTAIDDYCDNRTLNLKSGNGRPQIYFKNPIGYKRAALPSETRYQTVP